jgi:hypothetical protein
MSNEQRLDRVEDMLDKIAFMLNVTLEKSGSTTNAAKIVGPDEAAKILGLPVTKSRTHTRRLAWYRNHGFLKKFSGSKPYFYNVQELQGLAKRISNGEVVIPLV